MDVAARQVVVTALAELARSPDHRDRADAGRGLAAFADLPVARDVLLDLVLDAGDTFVPPATTEALLRHGDAAGLAIVCAGVATAECERLDRLYAAVHSVLGAFEHDRDAAVVTCRGLLDDTAQTEQVRAGATRLIAVLTELRPPLDAAQDATT
ncbi:MAG TPA: hypothetical protein VFW65_09770 [Pseudonocardiaceae bacterium]|nr:hypothetical protein [Pseudonocardiaceae bacterium]